MTPCIRKTGKIKAVHGLIQSWPETKVGPGVTTGHRLSRSRDLFA
jgi:hypothetical protein